MSTQTLPQKHPMCIFIRMKRYTMNMIISPTCIIGTTILRIHPDW
jgi:hypothetical protein